MQRLPLWFGYAGLLPPLLLLIVLAGSVGSDQWVSTQQLATTLQQIYALMILSFLGGVHWGQAIPRNNNKQLWFAMVPTVAGLGILTINFFWPILALVLTIGLFWLLHAMDRRLMPIDFIPKGYFQYRRGLTVIYSAILTLHALVLLLPTPLDPALP